MTYDYFYGQQSELFTFYRVPKVLFTNERFWNISADAKMLYGILLDRMSLSAKNGWIDENGRVYIIFTIDEAKSALNCAEQKAIKLLSELEKKAGLIERKRQGLGKPNLIYVKNFISAVDSQLLNCENHNSGTMKITTQELPKSQCNNTDIMFGLQLLQDNDGNMELTDHLYLQELGYWEDFTEKRIISNSNQSELYFEEPDIEKFVARLELLYPETEYVNRLMTHSWGQKVVRFYDPDGNLIEVGTPV